MMACKQIAGVDAPRLLVDTTVRCYEGGHIFVYIIAVAMLVFCGFGVPAAGASIVALNRDVIRFVINVLTIPEQEM